VHLVGLAALGWAALSCAASTACLLDTAAPPPGELSMGVYAMNATPVLLDDGGHWCALDDVVPAAFSFEVALSQDTDSGETFLTLSKGYSRSATWDGQVVRSAESARRYFRQCSGCVTRLREAIDFALLSASQAAAVGNQCPANPLDGGVPAPNDAGISLPGARDAGFDALLACGELRAHVLVDEGLADGGMCPAICSSCQTHYVLRGERR
jgi:hypothetical protein